MQKRLRESLSKKASPNKAKSHILRNIRSVKKSAKKQEPDTTKNDKKMTLLEKIRLVQARRDYIEIKKHCSKLMKSKRHIIRGINKEMTAQQRVYEQLVNTQKKIWFFVVIYLRVVEDMEKKLFQRKKDIFRRKV